MLVLRPTCEHCRRPLPPTTEWRPGVSLAHQPASTEVVHKPVDAARQAALRARVGDTPPQRR
jgi:hypothetical protein